MTEYAAKVGFWLRAFDSITVEADSDAEAVEKATLAATAAMGSTSPPDHIDFNERRESVITLVARITRGSRDALDERIAFDADRIHPNNATVEAGDGSQPRRVVFSYLVPVHVEVEDGLVSRVTVIDETPVADPAVVEGDASYLTEAVAAADDGQSWPSWQFGY